jgi:outer membrane protein assembly factor BamB
VAVVIKTKKVVWRDTSFSPDWGSRFTPPRILDGNVIACSDHSIYSWNASTGKRNWKKALFTGSEKISFTTTGPFIHDGKIFVFEFGGHGFCLNPENGQTLWETYTTIQKDYGPAYGSCLQPIIVNDVLLVNAESSRLFLAYDARNGHLLQQFKDATYNGTNVIFDEETETCFVLADEKLKAFKVER